MDGPAYRLGAIRECFEESGLLLAKKKGDESGVLLEVGEAERERARKEIHGGKLKFVDWVEELGGVVDSGMILNFASIISTLHIASSSNISLHPITKLKLYHIN
jgi:hypothetical protein